MARSNGLVVRFLIRWVVSTIAVAVTAWLLPGIHALGATLNDQLAALILTGLVLGLLNAILRPVIIFLTLPATLITFGLFLIVINAVMISLTAWLLPAYFSVDNFWWALLGALLISIVSTILHAILKG
ncbi:phage holin family protein [Candidatus Acetothermia bacterium]|jgi:putative membrane protein|nr:phage holin family protein [Candidatus Acetothermia bacterium]MCI2431575.1 phage holin family protein [Candidatus Acetothermia bacterium]MCI2435845.1 phage holin family protein [Candidatus Acetothermia bacterium]